MNDAILFHPHSFPPRTYTNNAPQLARRYKVVAGEHIRDLAEGTEQTINVKKIIVHPGWNFKTIQVKQLWKNSFMMNTITRMVLILTIFTRNET